MECQFLKVNQFIENLNLSEGDKVHVYFKKFKVD